MLTSDSFSGASRGAGAEQPTDVERLRQLLDVVRLIVGTVDPDKVLPLVVDKTAALIGADESVLLLADTDGRATVAAAVGVSEAEAALFTTRLDEHLDVALRQLLHSRDGDDLVAVPVLAGGAIDGVLAAHWRAPRGCRPDDEFLLSAMADQTAIALGRALSYQRMYRSEREARETAERAVRTRDEILAMVSHDLRNPLGTISMSATLLLRQLSEAADASARLQASRIQRSVDQMIHLVDDLLDVARLETGTFDIELAPHDAVDVAREVVDPFLLAARSKSLELRLELPAGALPIACDRRRVLQVLSNLLGNAFKFTPAGGVVVVRVERQEAEVVFSVTDTGPGIAPEQLPLVFERFWRADRHSQSGSGLGLFIARSLIAAHGGRIWADSVVGVGSVFSFALAVLADP
jgi:signal transduction histidine kinase